MCLLHALRALGVQVPHAGPGPFWAVRDGNRFLRDFNMHLRYVPDTVLIRGGQRIPQHGTRMRCEWLPVDGSSRLVFAQRQLSLDTSTSPRRLTVLHECCLCRHEASVRGVRGESCVMVEGGFT